jgi:hypothetical protein
VYLRRVDRGIAAGISGAYTAYLLTVQRRKKRINVKYESLRKPEIGDYRHVSVLFGSNIFPE